MALAAAMLLLSRVLAAQQPRPLSLEATFGAGAGLGGGELGERRGIALEALLGVQFRAANHRALVAALEGGFQGQPVSDDVCRIGSRDQCLDDFPALATVGVLAGGEWWRATGASPAATLRLLAGPAYVHLDRYGPKRRGSAPGIQGRVDAGTRQLGPLAGVLSVRSTLVPRYRGQTLAAWALGVGLRLR